MCFRSIASSFTLILFTLPAQADRVPLCSEQIVGKTPIDLKITKYMGNLDQTKDAFYIQAGKIIYDRKKLETENSKTYCRIEYTSYAYNTFNQTWSKGVVQPLTIINSYGDNDEPQVVMYPRAKSNWHPVRWECPYIKTYGELRDELKPYLEVDCLDAGMMRECLNPKTKIKSCEK